MHALWGMGQMMFTKLIIVVDEHVDVQNEKKYGGAFTTISTPNTI